MNHIKRLCDEIDASVFTGEVLIVDNDRQILKTYVERWSKAIAEHEAEPTEETATNTMRQYTVIGHFELTGLKYLGHIEASSVEDALKHVAETYPDDSLCIAAIIEGRHLDAMEGEYVEDTNDFEANRDLDDFEAGRLPSEPLAAYPITCYFCPATVPDTETAIANDWEPSWFDSDGQECSHPVCSECAAARLKLDSTGELAEIPITPEDDTEQARRLS